jgi:hypothetical protein
LVEVAAQLCRAMEDPTMDTFVQPLFYMAHMLSEDVITNEYAIIRQEFIEWLKDHDSSEEIGENVNTLYFRFIDWNYIWLLFIAVVPWHHELIPYEDYGSLGLSVNI